MLGLYHSKTFSRLWELYDDLKESLDHELDGKLMSGHYCKAIFLLINFVCEVDMFRQHSASGDGNSLYRK